MPTILPHINAGSDVQALSFTLNALILIGGRAAARRRRLRSHSSRRFLEGLTDLRRRRGRPAGKARRRRAVLHAGSAAHARPPRPRRGRPRRPRRGAQGARARAARAGARPGELDRARCWRGCSSSTGSAASSSRTSRPSRASRAASTSASCSSFTIDPETAKDFDDAISVRREGDGIRAWVHIADVSWFVPAGSPLDHGAAEPGALDLRAGARSRRCCRTRSPTTLCSLRPGPGPADGDGRGRARRRDDLLPVGDPQRRASHLRAGRGDPRRARARRARAGRGARAGAGGLGRRCAPAASRAARCGSRAPTRASSSTAGAASRARGASRSRTRTR